MKNKLIIVSLAILAARPQDGFSAIRHLHFDAVPSSADVSQALSEEAGNEAFQELLSMSELPELGEAVVAEDGTDGVVSIECQDEGDVTVGRIFIEEVPLRLSSVAEAN